MSVALPAFQAFQYAFARHIRDPRRAPRPAGVPARRMGIYNELLFNHFSGFLDTCFPVCRALLGPQRWQRLVRGCFRDWQCTTPWFREIPREFIDYLVSDLQTRPLPPWFAELAHYEWAELAVDVMEVEPLAADPAGDLMACTPLLNPTLMNLAYQWPVHRIGPDYRPRKPQPSYLLVFRDSDDVVQFSATNPATARLLALLHDGSRSGAQACRQLAEEMQHPQPEIILHHGRQILADLQAQGVILGSKQ